MMWSSLKYVKTVLRNLVLPPAGPLLLALIGLLLLGHRPRLGRSLIAIGIVSLWLLSTPWVADAITGGAEHYPAFDWSKPSGAQAIVILGGGGQRALAPEYGGPAAEPNLLERLSSGAFLAQKTHLPVLVSGYHIEADAMSVTLARNFNLEVRWKDDQSYDTFENAKHSAQLLRASNISRVLLVTRATHMLRSMREFEATGIQVAAAPVGILAARDLGFYRYLPNPDTLARSYAALYELWGEPVRQLLQFTHLRRQQSA
jgi:uncharacterized SAM-binding protein YcdF (DUF218 family)